MDLIIELILLIIGFVLLIKGADVFVDGASNVAYHYKVSTIVVGLTIVAIGTSAPEAAVSITASLAGSNAISLGNVVGSNIFNILGVIGISALIANLKVDKVLIKRDFPFLIISSIGLLLVAYLFGEISRIIGAIFLILIAIYIYRMVKQANENKENNGDNIVEAKISIPQCILYIVLGLAAVIIGSDLVVDSSSYIASLFGLSQALIGLTIVAIGTSLPELVTSITALKKGDHGIVIGNVLGSSIFNILFILGISSVIVPMPIEPKMLTDILIMTIITILGAIFAISEEEIDRKEGIVLIILFLIYMTFIIIRN
ncbi:MAG: calcium/sodium antiporter [Methanobrevibacter boviskoreani]|jgi:cation:H+ antiporter|uniref:calcium/sodium antiporter n=1 Tax=Methanobrevibacter boviskoreani TaxID=1348249 RepID=UPI0023A8AF59|nr:calcium/sodium antiporter [Methanobrevibacter boviskoreani]MCI6774343.1 calcium/sodium antiporter [Methanobrevibacter boviskoreani]MDY5613931.1 calcium/sodium antiporter [Methanobrevibacter boviskoreani]